MVDDWWMCVRNQLSKPKFNMSSTVAQTSTSIINTQGDVMVPINNTDEVSNKIKETSAENKDAGTKTSHIDVVEV